MQSCADDSITALSRTHQRTFCNIVPWLLFSTLTLLNPIISHGGVLPEDRADVLYHSYDGGGVEVSGPSVLVLKKFGESVAVSGNYYVDTISSASIDVVTNASPYSEERTKFSLGASYLHHNTTLSLAVTNSEENDYIANSANFGISTDMFSGLTTVSMGYAIGQDEVSRNYDALFTPKQIDRQNYRLGLTQVVSKDLVLNLQFETITDEGYLNNPYRTVRYLNPDNSVGRQEEVYPATRTSHAAAIRSAYYLPYRAALHGEYRFFTDSWGINAHSFEVGYSHPWQEAWLFDLKYRHHTQQHADFYSDLFPYPDAQNFLARDKELSSFDSNSFGATVSYEFNGDRWQRLDFIERGSLNLAYEYILFDYADYRDLTATGHLPGEEPLYSFGAHVTQLYLSIWF